MHIAFFGLGNMGFPIAANLLKAGHRVTTAVHRDPAPAQHLQALGGTIAASPAEALRCCSAVRSHTEPNPENADAYARAYRRYRAVAEALRPLAELPL